MEPVLGWKGEILDRRSGRLLLLYKDGEIRGQIEIKENEQEDLTKWLNFLSLMNEPNLPKKI